MRKMAAMCLFLLLSAAFADAQATGRSAPVSGICYKLWGTEDHSDIMVVFTALTPSATTDTTQTSSDGTYSILLDEGLYSISMTEGQNPPVPLDPEFFFTQDAFEVPTITIPNGEYTSISGSVSGQWSADSRYIATGGLIVESGSALQILPGAKIVLGDGVQIDVHGSIQIGGNSDSVSVLTNRSSSALTAPWGRLRFHQDALTSSLEYCEVTSSGGVWFDNTAGTEIVLRHCTISWAGNDGIYCDASSPMVEDCTIQGCDGAGLFGRAEWSPSGPQTLHCSPQVLRNRIEGNVGGVVFDVDLVIGSYANAWVYCEPLIEENEIVANQGNGIEIHSRCRKASYEGGRARTRCNPGISGNLIQGNEGAGLAATNTNDWNNAGDASEATMAIAFESNVVQWNVGPGVSATNDNIGGTYTGFVCTTTIDFEGNTLSCNQGHGVQLVSGGGYSFEYCRALFKGNVIASNLESGVHLSGGTSSSPGQIVDNSIVGNGGSGVSISGCSASLVKNNIFAQNGFVGLHVPDSQGLDITFNDFWQNASGDVLGEGISEYFGVIITENANGDASDTFYNIFEDPLVQDIVDCDLLGGSPCIDAGDPDPTYNDPDGTIGDIGAKYYDQDPTSIPVDQPGNGKATKLVAYPNPFNPSTTVRFKLLEAGLFSLTVYDAAGRHVRTLASGTTLTPGVQNITWDGCDASGTRVASGNYFCRLSTRGRTESTNLVLLK